MTFHPAVEAWLSSTFGAPTPAQARAWPAIRRGESTLVAAPTGSGKTLAAFLSALDELVRLGPALPDETRVVYVSPLKALSNDIQKNLEAPLAGIRDELRRRELPDVAIRTAVRTGDTTASARAKATKKPPHVFVTTPESLYILLTTDGGRRMLRNVRTVVVDEIHAMVGERRGSHLALTLERLDALVGRKTQRIGLSATQKPIEEVARFLVGSEGGCTIVDEGHVRARDLAIEVPSSPLETVMSGEVWTEVVSRIADLVREHRTTLVFVNTRKLAERVTRWLTERLGEGKVTSHHGSLSKEHRLDAEQRLKRGELSALVATASLELGIDVGDVDLVCQIGATRSIATFLQRVGRSGHHLGGTPKGRIFPLSRDELVEAAALLDAIRRGELDRLRIPNAPLDVLAQQIVAAAAEGDGWGEDELFGLVRRAHPYRDLPRERFDAVVDMLARGFATARGRRSAHVHHDAVNRTIRARKHARIAAITSGGAIPDVADYEVVLEPEGTKIGTLNEDFAIESTPGDIFQLGNASYRIRRVEAGVVRVDDARGQPPTMPFWLGEAPARSDELSLAVSRLRTDIAARLASGARVNGSAHVPESPLVFLREIGLSDAAASQLVEYVDATVKTLGTVPTKDTLVLERFFDETGAMHLVLHAPLGARVNRALGLALRKCFCRKFDFELQAAANEDALVLSLGPTHAFPLDEVWTYLKSATAKDLLVQALLVAPMFGTRWRWNTNRALAVLRFRSGKKVPPRLQRMDADDLLTVCFPDQVACLENVVGDREIPDHPLVQQTIDDCLNEAMDVEGMLAILRRIETKDVDLVARDTTEPSPLAGGILNAKPYAFLDDAPLEERRTQAVMSRRWLDASSASDLAALDEAAIRAVLEESWPEPRDADELADALALLGFAAEEEGRRSGWNPSFEKLRASGRATRIDVGGGLWVATERVPELVAIHPSASRAPEVVVPLRHQRACTREDAIQSLVASRLETIGPKTASEIARSLAVADDDVLPALIALEVSGAVFRGRFRNGATDVEFCDRRLLARIHRRTIERLRTEIQPVTTADFLRFAIAWQRASADGRGDGPSALAAIVEQLEGFEAPASAWETEILPARIERFDPSWLDLLTVSGRFTWLRRTPAVAKGRAPMPLRTTPIALVPRSALGSWRAESSEAPSEEAATVLAHLAERGASFFDDVVRGTGLLAPIVEEALGELVSRGLVSSDGFSGLRALVGVAESIAFDRRANGMESAGRWSALAPCSPADESVESIARALLRRWGVVFRRVLEREGALPPWRDLLRVYRRMEARGEIRGGRFVEGATGEQVALPEAVAALRETRKKPRSGELVALSAADPLNLVGIVSPGDRVPAIASNRVLFRDGVPIAVKDGSDVRILGTAADVTAVEIEALLGRRTKRHLSSPTAVSSRA